MALEDTDPIGSNPFLDILTAPGRALSAGADFLFGPAQAATPPTAPTPTPAPTGGVDAPFAASPADGSEDDVWLRILKRLERPREGYAGSVDAGPDPRTGRPRRVYGMYGVLDENIGPWTRRWYGRELTPAEYLANPEAQDIVARRQFGEYVRRFGPEGAAQAWFAGPGSLTRRAADIPPDVLGTSVPRYLERFRAAQAAERQGGPINDPGRTVIPPAGMGGDIENFGRSQPMAAPVGPPAVGPMSGPRGPVPPTPMAGQPGAPGLGRRPDFGPQPGPFGPGTSLIGTPMEFLFGVNSGLVAQREAAHRAQLMSEYQSAAAASIMTRVMDLQQQNPNMPARQLFLAAMSDPQVTQQLTRVPHTEMTKLMTDITTAIARPAPAIQNVPQSSTVLRVDPETSAFAIAGTTPSAIEAETRRVAEMGDNERARYMATRSELARRSAAGAHAGTENERAMAVLRGLPGMAERLTPEAEARFLAGTTKVFTGVNQTTGATTSQFVDMLDPTRPRLLATMVTAPDGTTRVTHFNTAGTPVQLPNQATTGAPEAPPVIQNPFAPTGVDRGPASGPAQAATPARAPGSTSLLDVPTQRDEGGVVRDIPDLNIQTTQPGLTGNTAYMFLGAGTMQWLRELLQARGIAQLPGFETSARANTNRRDALAVLRQTIQLLKEGRTFASELTALGALAPDLGVWTSSSRELERTITFRQALVQRFELNRALSTDERLSTEERRRAIGQMADIARILSTMPTHNDMLQLRQQLATGEGLPQDDEDKLPTLEDIQKGVRRGLGLKVPDSPINPPAKTAEPEVRMPALGDDFDPLRLQSLVDDDLLALARRPNLTVPQLRAIQAERRRRAVEGLKGGSQ